MPVADEVKSSWADEVELEGGALPPPSEVKENGFKIVTEYKYNEDEKKVKIVRTYKIEKRIVSKVCINKLFYNIVLLFSLIKLKYYSHNFNISMCTSLSVSSVSVAVFVFWRKCILLNTFYCLFYTFIANNAIIQILFLIFIYVVNYKVMYHLFWFVEIHVK